MHFGATTVDQETCTASVHTCYNAESHIYFSNHGSDIFVSVIVLNQTLIKWLNVQVCSSQVTSKLRPRYRDRKLEKLFAYYRYGNTNWAFINNYLLQNFQLIIHVQVCVLVEWNASLIPKLSYSLLPVCKKLECGKAWEWDQKPDGGEGPGTRL